MRTKPDSFSAFPILEIDVITRLHHGISHPCQNKFTHSFQDCGNPICTCGYDTEKTALCLLHCISHQD